MKRMSQLLQKHIRRSFGAHDVEKRLIQQHLKDWAIQKQSLPTTTMWDMIEASVILQGIHNKISIERAYIKVMDNMENYWSVLDYQERVRILNIDLEPIYSSLPVFYSNEKKMVIPFFDERFNEMYQNEMVIFSLKQYQNLMHEYAQWIQPVRTYRFDYYNGVFVPATFVMSRDEDYVLYHPKVHALFVRSKNQKLVFPLFDASSESFLLSIEQQQKLADMILNNEIEAFMEYGCTHHMYQVNFKNKMIKKWKRKGIFF